MHWLIDNPGIVYFTLGIVAVGFLIAFRLRGRVLHLGGAASCLALMGLFWLLTLWIVTDRKQITANVRAMAEAVVAGDVDRLFKFVARDFRYKTMERDDLYRSVQMTIKQYKIKEIYVWEFEFENVSRAQGRAKVNFNARVDGQGGTGLFLVKSDFTLEGDLWKMKGLHVTPINNVDQEIDIGRQ
jgi:hypothetical protein